MQSKILFILRPKKLLLPAKLSLNFFSFFNRRGSLLFTSIFIYTVTSPINGYFGGSLFARMGGKMWIQQMIVSAFLLPTFACSYPFYINLIAVYYESSRVISFGTMVSLKNLSKSLYRTFQLFILDISSLLLK